MSTNPPKKFFIFCTADGTRDNSLALWTEHDRGWHLETYEVVLTDPLGTSILGQRCDILVTLNNHGNVKAKADPDHPDPPDYPTEKLFLLRSIEVTGPGTYNNFEDLWSELDRGWRIGPYEVIMKAPSKGACYTLIKLTSPTPIPAVPPSS